MDGKIQLKISHKLIILVIAVSIVFMITSIMAISKLNKSVGYNELLANEKSGLVGLVDNGRHLQALFKELRISAIKYPMTVTVEERNRRKRLLLITRKFILMFLTMPKQGATTYRDAWKYQTAWLNSLMNMKKPHSMK